MKIEDILLNEKEVMSLQDMRSTSLGAIGHDKIVAAAQLRKALIMLDNGRLLSHTSDEADNCELCKLKRDAGIK